MAEKPYQTPTQTDLTAFVTPEYYVIGAGETRDEIQAACEWLATDTPRDIRR